MSKQTSKKEVLRRETRYAVHLPKNDKREDTHYVKEHIYYKDGTDEPRTFLVKDFQRPVWVTQQAHRNHKDKKEFERRELLMEQKSTQSDINRTVAGLLGTPHLSSNPDAIKSSPYVYGYDQTSTSLIKLQSLMRNQFAESPYSVATFDTETDIETREILAASIAMRRGGVLMAYMCVQAKFLSRVSRPYEQLLAGISKYLPEYKDKVKVQLIVHEHEVDLIKDVFRVANEWAPDFLAIWNINFDIPRVLERLKHFGVHPAQVLCDQRVPWEYRMCRYKEGITKKVTASGKVKPVNPSLQWHTLHSTSTFYVIDAMCVYRQLRIAKQEEPSYSLDSILRKELKGRGKLNFKEADGYSGAKWHTFMQQEFPMEYLVYHLFDCLGMIELEEQLRDLSNSLPASAAMTDFARFNSNPKKIVDALFIFGLERGEVVGTVGKINKTEQAAEADLIDDNLLVNEDDDDEEEEEDESKYKSLDLKGWIQLLPQNLLLNEGLKILEDYPDVATNVRGLVWDVDATAAYPTCTLVGNVSKATCVNEIIQIEGLREEVFREQNLSVCMGGVNMLEYASVCFGMPTLDELGPILDKMLAG